MIESELKIGKTKVTGRIVFPPMATRKSMDGKPGDEIINHYKGVALKSDVGMIITEHSYIDKQGKADPNQMSVASDDMIPYLKKVTEAVHEVKPGILVISQISHAGANTSSDYTGQELVSASSTKHYNGSGRALTKDEIHALEVKFAEGARRVKESGYDGVEIHCAHGYLLNQFFSPLTNSRDDEYGPQTIENRMRFLIETVRLVRKTVGDDFIVAVRLGGCDYLEGGSTIEDAVKASVILEKEGVDFIDLSGGFCGSNRKDNTDPGYFSDMTSEVKKQVRIPVLLTGGIKTREQAEKFLENGSADLIGVGRGMARW